MMIGSQRKLRKRGIHTNSWRGREEHIGSGAVVPGFQPKKYRKQRRCFMMRLVSFAAASVFALSLTAVATAQTVTLRLGNDVAANTIQAKADEKFAEEVAKRNVGIEVKVFHNNQLGTGVQQIQNVKLGIQEIVNTGYELLEPFSDDIRIAGTPFFFSDRDHFETWLRSPAFEKVQQEIVKNGGQRIINLGVIWRRGPYRVMIANRPIPNLV